MLKKIFIIGTKGLPGQYGGFETLVDNLAEFDWSSEGFEVYVSGESPKYSKTIRYKNVKRYFVDVFKANGTQSIFHDGLALLIAAWRGADVILMLGVSGAIWLPLLKLLCPKIKIITNIDGLEWRRNKWSIAAKQFLKLSEFVGVHLSDAIISDNKVLQRLTLKRYNKKSTDVNALSRTPGEIS